MKSSSDLCSRLEETNIRMKKVSQVFSTCEEFFSDLQTSLTDNKTIDADADVDITAHSNTYEQVCPS